MLACAFKIMGNWWLVNNKLRWLRTFWVVVLCASCSKTAQTGGDPFYTSKGGWDYARMPLVKPYEMWLLNQRYYILENRKNKFLVIDPISICVASNVVFGKAGNQDSNVNGKSFPAGNAGPFFALYMDTPEPNWFVNEGSLRSSLDDPQVRTQAFQPVVGLFAAFQQTGKCSWIPSPVSQK